MDRGLKAAALLNVSGALAKKAQAEGAKPGGLRQSAKATDIALKANEAFGKAVGIASQSGRLKKAGTRMATAQAMQKANRTKMK